MMSAVVNLDECAFLFDEMVFLVGGHLFARLLKTNSKFVSITNENNIKIQFIKHKERFVV